MIKVALTIWEDRISPVFDSAKMLMIVEIERQQIVNRRYAAIQPENTKNFAGMLIEQSVDVLICGAVSLEPAAVLESCGIELISFIAGEADEILNCFIKKNEVSPAFLMPGCAGKTGGKGKRHKKKCIRHTFS